MKYTIHAGHNPDGLVASGAAGYVKESVINRQIVNTIMQLVESDSIIDVTVNNGISQNNILRMLCNRMNICNADFNISIHCNAGGGSGIEAWTYGASEKADNLAQEILNNIEMETGFQNRGVKHSESLYILRHTLMPTIILEIGFVDNKDDAEMLMNSNVIRDIAICILEGIGIDWDYNTESETDEDNEHNSNTNNLYRVQVGAFTDRKNAENLAGMLSTDGYEVYITGGV